MSSIYIRLDHIGPTWTTTHPDAVALLPDGYAYTMAGTDGAWAEPVESTQDDAARWTEAAEDAPAYETVTRLLGPIPAGTDIVADDSDMWQHPGGPRPAWGGYAPIAVDEAGEQALREQRPDVVRLLAGDFTSAYWAHTTGTILIERGGSWYVLCPERPSRRAVVIACDALREGRRDALASLIGLRPDEAEQAEKLHAERQGGRAYCAPLPWEPQVAPTLIGDGADPGEIEIIRRPVAEGDEE